MLRQIYVSRPEDLRVSRLTAEFFSNGSNQRKDFLVIKWGQRTLMLEFTSDWEKELTKLPLHRYQRASEWDKMITAIQAHLNKESKS